MKIRRKYVAVTAIAAAALGVAAFANLPVTVLYNPSASAPVGFYAIDARREYNIGDFVAADLPVEAEKLAVEREYLPQNTPVLKTISASQGDEICIQSVAALINGAPAATLEKSDSLGRPMPIKTGCYRLRSSEYFLLSTAIKNSFDSRYFGPVGEDDIWGVATPLLIFSNKNQSESGETWGAG